MAGASKESVVMVVDIDDEARKLVSDALSPIGLEVCEFDNGSEALRYIQAQPWTWAPSLIVTELMLKGLSGLEFMRRVNELFPRGNVPFIVVGSDQTLERLSDEETLSADKLAKPISETELVRAVRKVTKKKRRRRRSS